MALAPCDVSHHQKDGLLSPAAGKPVQGRKSKGCYFLPRLNISAITPARHNVMPAGSGIPATPATRNPMPSLWKAGEVPSR